MDNPLTSITSIKTTAPDINTHATWDTFAADRSGIDLVIPTGSMGSYVTDPAAEWTGFNSVTESATLSTSSFEFNNNIKLLTNKNDIKITFSNNLQLQKYTVYNISGVEVAKGNINEIPTTSITSGIYLLKLDFDKGEIVKKIIIR